MKYTLLLLVFFSFTLHAEEPWHMISFGRDGFGWSGTSERIDSKSNSDFKSVNYFLTDLSMNYAFRISRWFQLGGFFENYHSEYKFKKKGGGESPIEIETNTLGIFLLYNFREDLNDSWYVGPSISISNYEEENSHDFGESEQKAPFELDDNSLVYEMIIGKRFSLRGFKVDNLSYSPQVNFFHRTHGKDFDDQNLGSGSGVNIQPIRFDLLF